MFRRRRTNGNETGKEPSSAPELPRGEEIAGEIWYKKSTAEDPQHPLTPEDNQTFEVRGTSPGTPPRFNQRPLDPSANVPPKHQPTHNLLGYPSSHRSQSPRSINAVAAAPRRRLSFDESKRGSSFTQQKERSHSRNQEKDSKYITRELIRNILKGNEWSVASQLIGREPKCVRGKDSMTILNHSTIAYPLHAAVTMDPPMSFFERLYSEFPTAVKMVDEATGRTPLHWGCLASAPTTIIRKLIDIYPTGAKVMDKIHGRLPLHYIVTHATHIWQVTLILDAEPRGVHTKDKQSKTPLDLAHATSNPLKLDILAVLHKKRISQKKKSPFKKGKTKSPSEWENPGNVVVMKGPVPGDFGTRDPPVHDDPLQLPSSKSLTSSQPRSPKSPTEAPIPRGSLFNRVIRRGRNGLSVDGRQQEPIPQTGGLDLLRQNTCLSEIAVSPSRDIESASIQVLEQNDRPTNARNCPSTREIQSSVARSKNAEYITQQLAPKIRQESPAETRDHPAEALAITLATTGYDLLGEMETQIQNLNEKVLRHQHDLEDNDTEIAQINGQLHTLGAKEMEISHELEHITNSTSEHRILLQQKKVAVEQIRQQILDLQQTLFQEEAVVDSVQLTISDLEDSTSRSASSLKGVKDRSGNLVAIRQVLKDEKATVTLDIHNCESELRSLKVIQNLAIL